MTQTNRLAAGVLLLTATWAQADEAQLIPVMTGVANRSQAEWSQAWWQWAGSFDRADSPAADPTGERCGAGQAGPVWFLAGTYGTARTVRTCVVPRGRLLFFPLINYVVMPPPDGGVDCDAVRTQAAVMTDDVDHLVLEIDGKRFTNLDEHRLVTDECFDMGARTKDRYRVYPSAANGYYVMIAPLPPGRHEIHFGGALPTMVQAVSYTLIVE